MFFHENTLKPLLKMTCIDSHVILFSTTSAFNFDLWPFGILLVMV